MIDVIFREYDIRGKIGTELDIAQVYTFAGALAYYLKQLNPDLTTLAVGMDGRTHSPELKERLCAGLMDAGINIIFVGICPSPALYFALHELAVDGGVMITASHNPKEYNGFKLCLGTVSLWGHQIEQLRELFKKRIVLQAAKKGTISELPIIPRYIEWLSHHFRHLIGMKMPIIIDSGNGAAAVVIPDLVKKMEWHHITLLCNTLDGSYPNHEADPTKAENMLDVKALLATTDAVLGIGLDGDADRMTPMTKSGKLVPGDQLLALFSKPVLQQYPGSTVVMDVKCSSAVLELIKSWHGKTVLSPCGHAIVKEYMKKNNARIGGELSCHFMFVDRYFGYDDGIYAFLRLLELLLQTSESLDQMLKEIPIRYGSTEIRMPCSEEKKRTYGTAVKQFFMNKYPQTATFNELDGVRVTMPYGWGIIRPSNTQSMVTLRFESESPQGLTTIKQNFFDALCSYFDASFLRTYLDLKDLQ